MGCLSATLVAKHPHHNPLGLCNNNGNLCKLATQQFIIATFLNYVVNTKTIGRVALKNLYIYGSFLPMRQTRLPIQQVIQHLGVIIVLVSPHGRSSYSNQIFIQFAISLHFLKVICHGLPPLLCFSVYIIEIIFLCIPPFYTLLKNINGARKPNVVA